MPTLLARTVGMIMLFVVLPLAGNLSTAGKARPLACLPEGIKPDAVVSSERAKSQGTTTTRQVTVSKLLIQLRARCQKGKLIDRKGREIYFYRLIGCWGNPPEDYQEQLEKQRNEVTRLKTKYTVIEIPCSHDGDPRKISL